MWARGAEAITLLKRPPLEKLDANPNGSGTNGAARIAAYGEIATPRTVGQSPATNGAAVSVELADLATLLAAIRDLAERFDQLNTPTVPDDTVDELTTTIARVSSIVEGLPNRIAQAFTVALRTQQKLILQDVRDLLEDFAWDRLRLPPPDDLGS